MKYHVGMLVEKSLIKVKTVTLHDLTEDMGKKFVTQGSARELGSKGSYNPSFGRQQSESE